jgi:hypothetical protein
VRLFLTFFLPHLFRRLVRSDWIMYLFAFMVGAAHYCLPLGRRLQDPKKDKNIYTRKLRRNWHEYGLPKPAYLTSTTMAQTTCLICLIQFVVAPDLMKIVAFNHDATAWGQPNGGEGPGALHITFLPGEDESDLLHISSPLDLQSSLRTEFVEQEGSFGVKGGAPRSTLAVWVLFLIGVATLNVSSSGVMVKQS